MAKKDETSVYICHEPIKHDGDLYEPGDEIDLTKDQAAQLLAIGHVSAPAKKGKQKDQDPPPPGGDGDQNPPK